MLQSSPRRSIVPSPSAACQRGEHPPSQHPSLGGSGGCSTCILDVHNTTKLLSARAQAQTQDTAQQTAMGKEPATLQPSTQALSGPRTTSPFSGEFSSEAKSSSR